MDRLETFYLVKIKKSYKTLGNPFRSLRILVNMDVLFECVLMMTQITNQSNTAEIISGLTLKEKASL